MRHASHRDLHTCRQQPVLLRPPEAIFHIRGMDMTNRGRSSALCTCTPRNPFLGGTVCPHCGAKVPDHLFHGGRPTGTAVD